MTAEIAAPKPDPGAKSKKHDAEPLLKRNFERKITSAKIEKICWQITIAALMQPFQYDWRGPVAKQNSIRKQPRQYKSLQNIEEEPIRRWNERHRNRRTHDVPFIAGCSHLTRKKTRFRAPASSPKQTKMQHSCAHYNAFCSIAWQTRISLRTWQQNVTPIMQPFHCDLQPPLPKHPKTRTNEQPPVAEHTGRTDLTMKRVQLHPPHTCEVPFHRRLQPPYTEKNTVSCSGFLPKTNPMQHSCTHYNAFCIITWQTRIFLRTWQQNVTPIMQPFHCDLQPQLPKHPTATHTRTTTRCRTHRKNRFDDETNAAAPAAHMWGTFHRQLQPLYTEKHTVSRSGFLPKTKPVQHSCSHDNAFCNLRFNKRIRKHGQALAAELREETDYARNDRSGTPLWQEVPFIAGCSHYTRKTQGFVLWLPPQTKPMQHSCSQYNAFCGFTWQTRISLRTWPQNMATII